MPAFQSSPPRVRALLGVALALALGAATPRARADGGPTEPAKALFEEAIKLLDAGRTAEACPKLEESKQLDPRVGTEFELADCYERMGRTASAWSGFVALAGRATKPDHIKKARARAEAL